MEKVTVGATLCGLLIGTLVLCANFQFGLQTGWVSMMSMPAALLGFAFYRILGCSLSPQENVYIQSVAVAVGTGPLSFGLVGAIPAIQLLLTDDEGRSNLTCFQLMVWSLGIGYIGIFTAVLLRRAIISDKQMKFPSGSAAAALIGVLHNKAVRTPEETERFFDGSPHSSVEPESLGTESLTEHRNKTYSKNILALAIMFVFSSIYTLANKIFGILKDLPIFGRTASVYMWTFDLSPAYIGQGIIMGLPMTASMMIGAVLGWAVLVPLSDRMNWATGPIDDWQSGAQGWIMWVSLAVMMADTMISFAILTWNTLIQLGKKCSKPLQRFSHDHRHCVMSNSEFEEAEDRQYSVDGSRPEEVVAGGGNEIQGEKLRSRARLPLLGMAAASVLCVICVKLIFGGVKASALAIAILMSPFLSLLGIRALGETDLNPVSSIAKLTQFVFGVLMHNEPHSVLLNIVAGAISEAGAQQAGDLMQDYKTGSLLGALMTNQTIGMIIGTTWSVLVSGIVYNLYTSHFDIPGPEFRIPTSYIWADCARLMTGRGLPPKAGIFSLALGLVFAGFAILKHCKQDRPWAKWIPSGVAVGIGMYNVPSFTISRFLGGLAAFLYTRRCGNPSDDIYLVILSSGLILGEGLMSVIYLFVSL